MLSLVDTQCVTDKRSVAVQRRVTRSKKRVPASQAIYILQTSCEVRSLPLYGTVLASPMVEASVTMLSDPNWKAAGFAGHIR